MTAAKLPKRLYVPAAEFEAETAELERLKAELTRLREELRRREAEEYARFWRENVRLARAIRRTETRLAELKARHEALRRIGWARLKRAERVEYLHLRRLITRVEARLAALREAQEKVIAELRRITEELIPLRTEIMALQTRIAGLTRRIKRKVLVELKRVELNLYVIIESGLKTYRATRKQPATARKHGRVVTVTRIYPKGRFQAWVHLDCWVISETGTVLWETDPAYTLIFEYVIPEVNEEFSDLFHILPFTPQSFTIGETSTILDEEDLGKPPVKFKVERTVDKAELARLEAEGYAVHPKNDWSIEPKEFILTEEEYRAIVTSKAEVSREMREYLEELRRRRIW